MKKTDCKISKSFQVFILLLTSNKRCDLAILLILEYTYSVEFYVKLIDTIKVISNDMHTKIRG